MKESIQMGFSALINGKRYQANDPAVLDFVKESQEITCPNCQAANLYYRHATPQKSAYFATLPSAEHKEWCTFPSKKYEEQGEKPIKIFDRFFGVRDPEKINQNTGNHKHKHNQDNENTDPQISSLKKFVEFLDAVQNNPDLVSQKFDYRGDVYTFNDIYFNQSNLPKLYKNVKETNEYEIDESLVFIKLKVDKSPKVSKVYVGEMGRSLHNPSAMYSVNCMPFTYRDEEGKPITIRPRVNFKDRTLMDNFLENETNIIWATPKKHINHDNYLDFDIQEKGQMASLPKPVQTVLFKIPQKRENVPSLFKQNPFFH